MMRLDHLAICAATLEEGVAWAEARLGVRFGPGGQHPRFGTHNRLLGLANGLYLEVIAIDPSATPAQRPRWFGLDAFSGPPRLTNWICRVPDIATACAAFPEVGPALAMTRGDLRWQITVPQDGGLPMGGALPTLITWDSAVPPGERLPPSGLSLRSLVITHPEAGALAQRITLPDLRFEVGAFGLTARFGAADGREVVL